MNSVLKGTSRRDILVNAILVDEKEQERISDGRWWEIAKETVFALLLVCEAVFAQAVVFASTDSRLYCAIGLLVSVAGLVILGKNPKSAVLIWVFCLALVFSYRAVSVLPKRLDVGACSMTTSEMSSGKRVLEITGRISNFPIIKKPGQIALEIQPDGCAESVRYQLLTRALPWEPAYELQKGDWISAEAKLFRQQAGDSVSPFSYEAYLQRRGVVARGIVSDSLEVTSEGIGKSTSLNRFVLELERRFGDDAGLPVILASVLGDESQLGDDLKTVFRETGTTHLLVVSGYHIGLVFGVLSGILRWLMSRSVRLLLILPAELCCVVLSVLGAAAYAHLSGWGVPTSRAFIVLLVFAIGKILGRRGQAFRTLVVSALCIFLIWPGAFFEVSFQLTYAAVLGIIFGSYWINRIRSQKFLKRILVEPSIICFSTWLFTAPVCLIWFGSMVPLGALINLLAIPVFSLACILMPTAALLGLYLHVPGSDRILELSLTLTNQLIFALKWISDLLHGTPLGYGTQF